MKNMTNSETIKYVRLINEVDSSIRFIKKGLGELQQISGANDFYYPPIMLISSGFEKLMKCILCYYIKETKSRFPDNKYLLNFSSAKNDKKGKGHNLWAQLENIISICKEMNYGKSVATKNDIDFLISDDYLHKIIRILSDFAQGGRYYNLDIVTEGNSRFIDPSDNWAELEMNVIKEYDELEILMKDLTKIDELYKEINKHLIICLEKFVRALSRLFTLAELGNEAKKCTGIISDFLFLEDSELGTIKYS